MATPETRSRHTGGKGKRIFLNILDLVHKEVLPISPGRAHGVTVSDCSLGIKTYAMCFADKTEMREMKS